MSFMEHQVLGYKSPLYGRKTGQFKIRPFDIFNTKKMLPQVNNEDLLAYYGITDGIPQYLSFIDQTKSVEENIQEMFLNQNAPLQNEPNVLLQEELRKPATYFSILNALAHGKSKSTQISQAIGMSNGSSISAYLNNLIDLEIIERSNLSLKIALEKLFMLLKIICLNFGSSLLLKLKIKLLLKEPKEF